MSIDLCLLIFQLCVFDIWGHLNQTKPKPCRDSQHGSGPRAVSCYLITSIGCMAPQERLLVSAAPWFCLRRIWFQFSFQNRTPWPQQPALHQNEISNVWLSLPRTVRCVLHGRRFCWHVWLHQKRIFGGWYYACCSRQQQERTAGLPKNKKLWNQIVPLKNRLDKVVSRGGRTLGHSIWYLQNCLTAAGWEEPVKCSMLVLFFRWCGARDTTL